MYAIASLEDLYFLLQLLEATSHAFPWFTVFIYWDTLYLFVQVSILVCFC